MNSLQSNYKLSSTLLDFSDCTRTAISKLISHFGTGLIPMQENTEFLCFQIDPFVPCSPCRQLPSPSNGWIEFTHKGKNDSSAAAQLTSTDSTVRFHCQPGYMLDDPEDDGIRSCGIIGEWMGGEGSSPTEPKCRRE